MCISIYIYSCKLFEYNTSLPVNKPTSLMCIPTVSPSKMDVVAELQTSVLLIIVIFLEFLSMLHRLIPICSECVMQCVIEIHALASVHFASKRENVIRNWLNCRHAYQGARGRVALSRLLSRDAAKTMRWGSTDVDSFHTGGCTTVNTLWKGNRR